MATNKRKTCKHCGAKGMWMDHFGKMVWVNIPGFTKHICITTKKDPIKEAVKASPIKWIHNEPDMFNEPLKLIEPTIDYDTINKK